MSVEWNESESDPVAEADLAAHVAKTTAADDVHSSKTYADSAIAAAVAGLVAPDLSSYVQTTDPRLADQRTPSDGSVTAAKVNTALKPSGSATAGDEALRALGAGSTQAAAGDDSRFPTAGQKNALAGTSGTPGSANQYVTNSDSRLSDARTPTAHASSHASAGSDPLTIAESQVTGLTADLAAKAPLASPALTGNPTVPTQVPGTNSTRAASTAYADAAVAVAAVAASVIGIKPRTGDYVKPLSGSTINNAVSTGFQQFIPILVGAAVTVDRIGVWLQGAAGTTGTVRLGIYTPDANGFPSGVPLLDAGTADTTTGAGASKEIVISQALTPGLWWLSGQSESTGTAPSFTCAPNSNQGTVWPFNLATAIGAPNGNGLFQGHTGAFGSVTPGSLSIGSNTLLVYVRAA